MSAKKRDIGIMAKAAQVFDLPTGDFENTAHIEFIGNREVSVSGCRGIIEYNDIIIRLNIGRKVLRLSGNGMSICNMFDNDIVITGNIQSMEFEG